MTDMQEENNNNNNQEFDLFLYYVKDVGFETFTFLCDLLTKTVTDEKPLSPYTASAMISNLVINFINEYTLYNNSQQNDEKAKKQLKKDMFDAVLKFIWFENNKEIAQEIQDHPEKALDLLKQKYANMVLPPSSIIIDDHKKELDKMNNKEEEEEGDIIKNDG